MSDLLDPELPVTMLAGERVTLGALTGGRAALIVNVASRCGMTPQYTKLEALYTELAGRGFTVVGFRATSSTGRSPGRRPTSRSSARPPTASRSR